jgi:CDP-4-dehydro-6-deoxyglucose reductase/ferredoxin-NAD(P)+ reductase (naphthalene dioxygenase ferredoxin-specific)
MTKLTIRQWPLVLQSRGRTILDAALAAGVPYPHGCRTGECGSCKSTLVAGEVEMSNYDEAVLSDDERAAGLVLACCARPKSDTHVAWLGEEGTVNLPVQRLRAQITNIERVTPHITRIYAWPEYRLKFAAGQFAKLRFADLPARCYSMANRPDEEALEFHIRLLPEGRVSEHIRNVAKVGETIRIEGPFGRAHLHPDEQEAIICIAGGSGLAPIKSLIRTALHGGMTADIHLFFGVRDEENIYDEVELATLAARHPNLHVNILLSTGSPATMRRVGSLADVLGHDLPGCGSARIYVAGPPPMVESVVAAAQERGIASDRIHADPFHHAGEGEPGNGFGFGRLLQGLKSVFGGGWLGRAAAE